MKITDQMIAEWQARPSTGISLELQIDGKFCWVARGYGLLSGGGWFNDILATGKRKDTTIRKAIRAEAKEMP